MAIHRLNYYIKLVIFCGAVHKHRCSHILTKLYKLRNAIDLIKVLGTVSQHTHIHIVPGKIIGSVCFY